MSPMTTTKSFGDTLNFVKLRASGRHRRSRQPAVPKTCAECDTLVSVRENVTYQNELSSLLVLAHCLMKRPLNENQQTQEQNADNPEP